MRKLTLSKLPESDRLIGFTIPSAGVLYICDHDAVWRVALETTPRIEITEHQPYEFVKGRTDFLGLIRKGFRAGDPLLRVGQNEVAYDFDPQKDRVEVHYEAAGRSGTIEFRTLSGDWFAASFSDDGRHLVLAEPYDIAVYEIT